MQYRMLCGVRIHLLFLLLDGCLMQANKTTGSPFQTCGETNLRVQISIVSTIVTGQEFRR